MMWTSVHLTFSFLYLIQEDLRRSVFTFDSGSILMATHCLVAKDDNIIKIYTEVMTVMDEFIFAALG